MVSAVVASAASTIQGLVPGGGSQVLSAVGEAAQQVPAIDSLVFNRLVDPER